MSTFAATQALRIVLREEQPVAMEEVLRDLERARMRAEDSRATMASRVIEPAIDLLHHARHEILTALSAPCIDAISALSAAYNRLLRLEVFLEENLDASEPPFLSSYIY